VALCRDRGAFASRGTNSTTTIEDQTFGAWMTGDAGAFTDQILVTSFIIRIDHVSDLFAPFKSCVAQAFVTFADDVVDASVSAAGDGRQIFANGGLFAVEWIFLVKQALRFSKPNTLYFRDQSAIRRNAPTTGVAALKRPIVAFYIASRLVVVDSSCVESALGLVPPAKALFKDWSGRSDLQPVGTLLRTVAFVCRDASLLPELVLAVIEQLSWWTLTLLAGKDAIEIFADEIKRRIADANFILPHLPSRERRSIQSADFEVCSANVSLPILDQTACEALP